MRDLVQYAFDFFAHVLPGLVILFSISLLFIPIDDFDHMVKITAKVNTGIATVAVIASYIIGYAIYPFGRFLYRSIGFKLWGKKVENRIDMFHPNKFVLIREYSPSNFKYVETWYTYCAMSHNLAIASLILCLVSIIKLFVSNTNTMIWLGIVLFAIFLFFVFLYRAVTFYHWASHDLNATIEAFNLDKKVYDSHSNS